jgi:hypothetical protein
MSAKDQLEQIAKRRRKIGKCVLEAPGKFKICHGCQSLTVATNTFCPFCRGYGFESNPQAVVMMARVLGDRPLATGCAVLPRITSVRAFALA